MDSISTQSGGGAGIGRHSSLVHEHGVVQPLQVAVHVKAVDARRKVAVLKDLGGSSRTCMRL